MIIQIDEILYSLLYSWYDKGIQYLSLHGGLLGPGLLQLGDLGGALGAQGATAPVLPDLLEPVVVVGLNGLDQLGQGASVIGVDLATENGMRNEIIR